MNLESLLNSRFASLFALNLAQIFPPSIGSWVAFRIADVIASQKHSSLVRSIYANQKVVHNGNLSPAQLGYLVRDTLRQKALSLYDYLHYLNKPEAINRMVQLTPTAEATFQRIQDQKATMMVIPHISNFDLAGFYLTMKGYNFQTLTFPQPGGGYRFQNLLRKYTGLKATPISISGLKKALDLLRSGGSVLTGIDRPTSTETPLKDRPIFFDHPANLHTGYIRLAMEAKVPVTVISVKTLGNKCYQVDSSEPIHVPGNSHSQVEILQNAEKILVIIENLIKLAPAQWSMFYPVWPDLDGKINQVD